MHFSPQPQPWEGGGGGGYGIVDITLSKQVNISKT